MKHKSHVLLLLACSIACSVQAQVDTLGKCPFYFMDAAIKDVLNMQEHTDSCYTEGYCLEYPFPVGISNDDYHNFNGEFYLTKEIAENISLILLYGFRK